MKVSVKVKYNRIRRGCQYSLTQGVSTFMLEVDDILMDGNQPAAGTMNQDSLAGQCWHTCISQLAEDEPHVRASPQSITVNGYEVLGA